MPFLDFLCCNGVIFVSYPGTVSPFYLNWYRVSDNGNSSTRTHSEMVSKISFSNFFHAKMYMAKT